MDLELAPEEAPEPDEAPEVEAPVEAPEEYVLVRVPAPKDGAAGNFYQILSDRMVHGKRGDVVWLDLDDETRKHLIGAGHLAVVRPESGPQPE